MIWLFLLALAAWLTYGFAVRSENDSAPRIAWRSLVVLGVACVVIAARFALMEPGVDFMDEYMAMEPAGRGAFLVPVINLFIALGPLGCAAVFGALGLFTLRKTWDGGWHRLALNLRETDV